MLVQHAVPGGDLGHWIHSYRLYTFTPQDAAHFDCLPGTGAELWLIGSGDPDADEAPLTSGLLCLRSTPLTFAQAGLRVFSIRFRAGALPVFSRRPLAELVDRYTPVAALWSANALAPLAAARRSADFGEQCLAAERFLLAQRNADRRSETMQRVAADIYALSADFALGDYAAARHTDRSVLSRQFRATQGISAKHYHRLCRFEHFLRAALFCAEPSLAGLAVDHGYSDQAHMQREVRAISRQSPRQLIARRDSRLFYAPPARPG